MTRTHPEAHVNELLTQDWSSKSGLTFWESADQFCRDCVEYDCPVFKRLRNHNAFVVGAMAKVRDACEYVQDYHEARDLGMLHQPARRHRASRDPIQEELEALNG